MEKKLNPDIQELFFYNAMTSNSFLMTEENSLILYIDDVSVMKKEIYI
jgi:hypothetical protein